MSLKAFFRQFSQVIKAKRVLILFLLGLVQEQWPCPFLLQMEAPDDKM